MNCTKSISLATMSGQLASFKEDANPGLLGVTLAGRKGEGQGTEQPCCCLLTPCGCLQRKQSSWAWWFTKLVPSLKKLEAEGWRV